MASSDPVPQPLWITKSLTGDSQIIPCDASSSNCQTRCGALVSRHVEHRIHPSEDAYQTGSSSLVTQFPRLATNIMREMAAHMTDALTRVREVTTQKVGRRLAMTLVRLARQGGRPHDEGILLTHVLTRQELADLTGTTLYTVSRTLSKWTSDGILSSHARRLIIRSPKRLSALADGSVDG